MEATHRVLFGLIIAAFGMPAAALAQPYVSGKIGYANADFQLDEPYNGVIDDNSFAYGFNAGIGVHPRFAIELGMTGYGDFDGRATPCPEGLLCDQVITPTSNDVTTYSLAIVPRFTIASVELFGRAGYYRADIDTDIAFDDNEFTERGLLIGAGARWFFNEPWSVSVQTSRFDDNLYQFAVGVGWGVAPFGE